jgi:hypothetical protein
MHNPAITLVPSARHLVAALPADLDAASYEELLEAKDVARDATVIQRGAAMRTPLGSPERQGIVWLMLARMAITDTLAAF